MKGEMAFAVSRPIEEVFDYLADIRNEPAWNPRALRLAKTTSGPIGRGTTFRGEYTGIGSLDTELVEYERPRRLAFRSHGQRMEIAGAFELSAGDAGTTVALTADLQPRGLFRLAAPLMAPMIRRQNAAAAERLRRALSPAGATP
jgi:hypothetical protein